MTSNIGIYDDGTTYTTYTVTKINNEVPPKYKLTYGDIEREFRKTKDLKDFDDNLKKFIGVLRFNINSGVRGNYEGITYTVTLIDDNKVPPNYELTYGDIEREFKTTNDLTDFDDNLKNFIGVLKDNIDSVTTNASDNADASDASATPASASASSAPAAPAAPMKKQAQRRRPSVPLPDQPTTILATNNTDYKFYVLNMLHDLVHDYYDKKDRMKAFKELNDAIKTRFPTQIGGSETLTMPAETQVSPEPKLVLRLVYDELEANGRKYIDTVFYELQFYYIGFTYVYENEKERFDFTKNTEAFMSLVKKNPRSLEEVMYNAFVTRCYNKFKTYKTLPGVSNVTSRDIVKDIRKFYSDCFKECSKEQLGGAKKRKLDDDDENLTADELAEANPLIISIVKNMKKKLVDDVTEDEKNQNLFLKVQSDIIDNFLIEQGSKYDENLYNGITLISAAFAQNVQRNSSIIRSSIFSRYSQPAYEDIFDIIDNSNGYSMYKGNVFCPVASTMDGIVEFKNHACYKAASEETGNTDIKLNVNDNQYVRLVRIEGYGLRVIIHNGSNVFSSIRYEQDTIVAGDIYRKLIHYLNSNDIDNIHYTAYTYLAIKSLGDIMQEWTATLKDGGYKNGPSYIPEASNIPGYNGNGDARRVLISNDRPSACRSLWILNNGKNRGASDWSNHINTETAAGYAHNATSYFMHDFQTDTICINKDEFIIRRDTFSTSFTDKNKTLSLYVAEDTYESINLFTDDEPIVYDILNKLLETGPINVTDNRERTNTGLNFIRTIPQGTKFKLLPVNSDDYMPYPTVTDRLKLRNTTIIPNITGRVNDVFDYIIPVEGNAFTNESRKMTQMINSELIYWQSEGQFGKFNTRKIVYVILPQQTQQYTQYGSGYQTGGMWQKGGFFMICS
ncbi:hypothetical protein N9064_01355 [bacterium]|nr:hypothetical protein [bacterium]